MDTDKNPKTARALNKMIAEGRQILAAIHKGRRDVRAGRTKSHAEVEKMLEEWIRK
jgi:predicted transcriptional regulator